MYVAPVHGRGYQKCMVSAAQRPAQATPDPYQKERKKKKKEGEEKNPNKAD